MTQRITHYSITLEGDKWIARIVLLDDEATRDRVIVSPPQPTEAEAVAWIDLTKEFVSHGWIFVETEHVTIDEEKPPRWDDEEKPRWKHDCDECSFLGRVSMPGWRPADLYCHHTNPSGHVTVLARFSDEGPDYTACDAVHLANPNSRISSEVLHYAYDLAVDAGYVVETDEGAR